MCKQYKIPIYSILTGIIITLLTALFPNVFLLGVSYWGYLLPWLRQLVYPGSKLEIIWVNFFVNILIWSVILYMALLSVSEAEAKKAKRPVRRIKKRRR